MGIPMILQLEQQSVSVSRPSNPLRLWNPLIRVRWFWNSIGTRIRTGVVGYGLVMGGLERYDMGDRQMEWTLVGSGTREQWPPVTHLSIREFNLARIHFHYAPMEPSACDYSRNLFTPGYIDAKDPWIPWWKGWIWPQKYTVFEGLYAMEPISPTRIPWIVCHGWISNMCVFQVWMEYWTGKEEWLDRYQLLYYQYPTGQPWLKSAAGLKRALWELYRVFPRSPAFQKMVCLGHSMGGLVIQWALTTARLENPHLDKIPTIPFVENVITVATPNQGIPWSIPWKWAHEFKRTAVDDSTAIQALRLHRPTYRLLTIQVHLLGLWTDMLLPFHCQRSEWATWSWTVRGNHLLILRDRTMAKRIMQAFLYDIDM